MRTVTTFIGLKKGKSTQHRIFLGDFDTVQYLEDSDLLDTILCPTAGLKRLPNGNFAQSEGDEIWKVVSSLKFRVFDRGIPIFRFRNPNSGQTGRVQLFCNHQDPFDKLTHMMSQFLELNRIDFDLEQELNSEPALRVVINGEVVSVVDVHNLALKGKKVLQSAINGLRCIKCASKIHAQKGVFCKGCAVKEGRQALSKEKTPTRV